MRTRASVGGHPVHAMLVHFPLAFLVGAFGFDLFVTLGQAGSHHAVGPALLAIGVTTGLVAAVPGVVDLLASVPKGGPERAATIRHGVLSALALVLFGLAWMVRDSGGSPGMTALGLEGLGTTVLLFAGRVGATLVLEHHIGASPLCRR